MINLDFLCETRAKHQFAEVSKGVLLCGHCPNLTLQLTEQFKILLCIDKTILFLSPLCRKSLSPYN